MAEEKSGEAQGAAPKGGKSKLIIILLAVVVLLGAGGGLAYFFGGSGSGSGEAQAAKEPDAHGAAAEAAGGGHEAGSVVPLDSFVVNLADEDAQRYLKVTIKVEFFGDQIPPLFHSRQAQIRDLLLTLLSSKNMEDVRTVEGKSQLRDEIIARVNRVLDDDAVKAVYFAEFIVQ
jgi:flagellar FliL protein